MTNSLDVVRDDEAELGVIGSLIGPDAAAVLAEVQRAGLLAEHFFSVVHRAVFVAVEDLLRYVGELDAQALLTLLQDIPGIETSDARRAYLDDIEAAAPTPANAGWFARRVVEAHQRREALAVLDEQRDRLMQPRVDVAKTIEATQRRLQALAGPSVNDEPPIDRTPWKPFPTDVLPARLQRLVVDGAEALHIDPTFVLLPGLAAAATAIGNARRIVVNETWSEPAAVWCALVADAGRKKSPPFKLATAPLDRIQDRLDDDHDPGDDDKDEAPRRVLTATDATIERLACILQDNPRGIGVFRDELSSWFRNLTKYGKGGSDVSHWLELYNDGTLRIHRKTGTPKYVGVRFANITLCGTIQPETLRTCLAAGNVDNGLASRFLFAAPPKWLITALPTAVPRRTVERWGACIERLAGIELPLDDKGRAVPQGLPMTDEARALWDGFYLDHQRRLHDATGAYAGALSKLERYVLRIALIFHLIDTTDDPLGDDMSAVTEGAMRSAIATVEWFIGETERIYGRWNETEEDRRLRRLIEWLEGRGGLGTVRDLIAAHLYRTAAEAETDLQSLLRAGEVEAVSVPHDGPGRPRTEYVLRRRRAAS